MSCLRELVFSLVLLISLVSSVPLVQRSQMEVPNDEVLFPRVLEEVDFDKRDPESPIVIEVPESLRFAAELPRTDRKWQVDEEMILSARRHPLLKNL